jgi:hypothetical protein
MATPKKRYKYTIFYTDGAFMTFELTKEDYKEIELGLTSNKGVAFAAVSVGAIGLQGIRAIVEQKEEEPLVEDDEVNQDTLPALDQESYNWIKQYIGGE